MSHNSVELQSGYDQSLSSSDNIEGFTPSGGSPQTDQLPGVGAVYIYVSGQPEYSAGQPVIDPSAGVTYTGYAQVTYTTPYMHVDSFVWLRANYEGQVTVGLRTEGTTYTEWNAQLRFIKQVTSRVDWYEVKWIFTLVEAI